MKSKKITAALAMLLISAVLLSTASYAWFAMNTRVSADSLTVGAYSDSLFLQISETGADDSYDTEIHLDKDVKNLRLTTPSLYKNLTFVTLNVPAATTTYTDGQTYYVKVASDMGGYDYVVADMSAYKDTASDLTDHYIKTAFVLNSTHASPDAGYTYYNYDYTTDSFAPATPVDDVYGLYAVPTTYTGETGLYAGTGTYYKDNGSGTFVNVTHTLYRASTLPADTYYLINAATHAEEKTTAAAGEEYYIRNEVNGKYEYTYLGAVAENTVLADYLFWGRAYSSSLTDAQVANSLTVIPEGDHGNYYLQQTLYIRQAANTNNASNLRIEKVTVTGATNPIGDALRILFVATSSSGETTTALYSPRNTTDANKVQDAILFDTLLGNAQETVTVQVYLYFDGTDAITYTSAINGGTLNGQNIEIEFAIDELDYN